MLHFYPASREVWERWYEQQKQRGQSEATSASTRDP
jgi:hypothetical protein